MFINNKYLAYYNRLCEKAKTRAHLSGYVEKHHIIPRSLGGDDSQDNLVEFTAREHYIAHLLLTKITNGESRAKMINAFFRMNIQDGNPAYRFINSHRFENARLKFMEVAGWYMRGKTYTELYGNEKADVLKKQRAEVKSLERKGRTWEQIFGVETAARMKKIRGEQAKAWNIGRRHSDETKKKISSMKANKVYKRIMCVKCSKLFGINNIKQHQSVCKF